jgi:colanic acid biosynthesis glycosyl transferase WcaI
LPSDEHRAQPSHVLILSQQFYPTLIGSAVYVTDLARWLAADGLDVHVVCERPFYPDYQVAEGFARGERDCERRQGITVRRMPTVVPRSAGALARLRNELAYLCAVGLRLARGHIPRAATVVSVTPSIFAVLAGRLARARGGRHVAVVHDIQSGLASGLGMLASRRVVAALRCIERWALNGADHIIVLTDAMQAALRAQGITRPITVLPLWVDTGQIRSLPRPPGSPVTVQYSGNLGRKQGWETVLAMAADLQARRPEVRLLIRGGGSQAAVLADAVRRRGLHAVALEPLLPPERLAEGLAEGDVHLVPQEPEGADFAVPSKIYPIMAAGRPFVCTAVPGSPLARIAAEAGAALCVPPGDPPALADAVIRLIDDPALCAAMGARGRAYVESIADRDQVLSRYRALLDAADPAPSPWSPPAARWSRYQR